MSTSTAATSRTPESRPGAGPPGGWRVSVREVEPAPCRCAARHLEGLGVAADARRCGTCCRDLPVDAGVCRPCRKQASLVAGPGNKTALNLSAAAVTGHQLCFSFGALARAGVLPADTLPQAVPPSRAGTRSGWAQPLLFDLPRDLSGVSARLPPADPGLAERLLAEAGRAAELHGWSPRTLSLTRCGLRILMAVHGPGEPVKASTVRQLTARNMPFPHI